MRSLVWSQPGPQQKDNLCGPFWASRILLEAGFIEWSGEPIDEDLIELVMLVRGPRGSLVVVHDSYPVLGVDGRHLQPPRVLADALLRRDGREGGVLAIVAREKADAIAALVTALGLDIGTWENGSRSAQHGDR